MLINDPGPHGNYQTVEIRLFGPVAQGEYPVELSVPSRRNFPLTKLQLDRVGLETLETDPQAYGRALGKALFAEETLGPAYRETLAAFQARGEGLRVRLRLDVPELEDIHWERMYHPLAGKWFPLGVTALTPFSRYVPAGGWERPQLVTERPLRILAVIASPFDLAKWKLDAIATEERQALHSILDGFYDVSVTYLESDTANRPTRNQLRRALASGYHLVHFLCHGVVESGGTALYLEDEAGSVDAVASQELLNIFAALAEPPLLCFLAVCESARRRRTDGFLPLGPLLVEAGRIEAVIAMTDQVGMRTAQFFADQFYTHLVRHGAVDLAMNEARAQVQDQWDWGVPVLFSRLPDNQLLAAPDTRSRPRRHHIPGYWEQCNGPFGAVVRALVVDPHDSRVLYAGMVGGGRFNGIYKSLDGGQSWKAIRNSPADREIMALAISYHDSSLIYAGTDRGLFVSTDQGTSWRLDNERLSESEVRCVSLSPQDRKLCICGRGKESMGVSVSAATVIRVGVQPEGILEGGGTGDLYVSTDGGNTWTSALIPNVNAIAISPQDSSIIYLGTSDEGVFKRARGAKGWLRTSALEARNVFSLSVSPQDAQHVLVGTNRGLYMSLNGGGAWQKIEEVGDVEVSTVAFAPQEGNRIYVGTRVGVFESLDKGTSWHEVNKGLTHLRIFSLVPLPDGTLYAGTDGGGIFKKGSNETSWQPCNDGLTSLPGLSLQVQSDNMIYVGTCAGLFRSENGGNSWQEVGYFNLKPVLSVALALSDATRHSNMMDAGDLFISTDEGVSWQGQQNLENPVRTLYVGTTHGCIYRSTDEAFSWQKSSEIGDDQVWSIIIAPRSSSVYATCGGGMFRSTDEGKTWQPVKNGLDGIYVVSVIVSPHNNNVLYAGTGKHGVCKSIDAGSFWNLCNNGLPAVPVRFVALSRGDSNLIYAATGGHGVYKSADGGDFWWAVNNGLDNLHITALVLSPENEDWLYAGTVDGIYRSTDAGKTWKAFSSGLSKERFINALALSPQNSRLLYAATQTGVFKVLTEWNYSIIDRGLIRYLCLAIYS
jgi:photosystem II stability/assembly factor-like uncharacterized protein